MSNTRIPSSGSFLELGDFAAVANPREKHKLPDLPRGEVALATKASLDKDKNCMTNREMYTSPLIMCIFFFEEFIKDQFACI
jgi:hypothetical protein